MTSVKRSRSVSRSGRCGAIAAGTLLRRQDRTGESAGHLAVKWKWSLGSEWQSLQMGLFGWEWLFLNWKWLASASSPSHPAKRQIRKLF